VPNVTVRIAEGPRTQGHGSAEPAPAAVRESRRRAPRRRRRGERWGAGVL